MLPSSSEQDLSRAEVSDWWYGEFDNQPTVWWCSQSYSPSLKSISLGTAFADLSQNTLCLLDLAITQMSPASGKQDICGLPFNPGKKCTLSQGTALWFSWIWILRFFGIQSKSLNKNSHYCKPLASSGINGELGSRSNICGAVKKQLLLKPPYYLASHWRKKIIETIWIIELFMLITEWNDFYGGPTVVKNRIRKLLLLL